MARSMARGIASRRVTCRRRSSKPRRSAWREPRWSRTRPRAAARARVPVYGCVTFRAMTRTWRPRWASYVATRSEPTDRQRWTRRIGMNGDRVLTGSCAERNESLLPPPSWLIWRRFRYQKAPMARRSYDCRERPMFGMCRGAPSTRLSE